MMVSSSAGVATPGPLRFVLSASLNHLITYFVAGLIASRALDYAGIFGQPVIQDYHLPYASVDVWCGRWFGPPFSALSAPVSRVPGNPRNGSSTRPRKEAPNHLEHAGPPHVHRGVWKVVVLDHPAVREDARVVEGAGGDQAGYEVGDEVIEGRRQDEPQRPGVATPADELTIMSPPDQTAAAGTSDSDPPPTPTITGPSAAGVVTTPWCRRWPSSPAQCGGSFEHRDTGIAGSGP